MLSPFSSSRSACLSCVLSYSPRPFDNTYHQNILAITRTDWYLVLSRVLALYHRLIKIIDDRLIDSGREFLYSRFVVKYGLMKRCERQVLKVPDASGDWQYVYTAFKCRDFPKSVSDRCET